MDIALFGRDLELSAGRAFLAAAPARALLVEGPAGIGKTAVWRALSDIARADGYLVLESIGDAAEARLTFAGELTPTERRVAELAAVGRSNKEIARALFVTVNTVEAHLSRAYARLGIRSRAQLAHRFGAGAEPGQP